MCKSAFSAAWPLTSANNCLRIPNSRLISFAGPDSYKRLPQLLDDLEVDSAVSGNGTEGRNFDVTLSEFETYSDIYPQSKRRCECLDRGDARMRQFLHLLCCTRIPGARERSRSPENVVAEARRLAGEGYRQITLLGQNVNSYQYEGRQFAELLEAVSEVEGIERIRFTSPHPKDFPKPLLKVIADNPKVCKQIHLPLQAGNTAFWTR